MRTLILVALLACGAPVADITTAQATTAGTPTTTAGGALYVIETTGEQIEQNYCLVAEPMQGDVLVSAMESVGEFYVPWDVQPEQHLDFIGHRGECGLGYRLVMLAP